MSERLDGPLTKHAVILAGGHGTRLRPYTVVLPKPLMPIGQYPILEVIVRQLAQSGFKQITLAVNHQANLIKAFFGDGAAWNLNIHYSVESEALSTIAPLLLIPNLPQQFLVMNGDVLTDLDFHEFWRSHVERDGSFTIAASRRTETIEYGVLHVDDSCQLSGFEEKPRLDYLVSMGVYMASRRILDYVPRNQRYGFDHLMRDLLANRVAVDVRQHEGYWLDIGRPDDYMKAIDDVEAGRVSFLQP